MARPGRLACALVLGACAGARRVRQTAVGERPGEPPHHPASALAPPASTDAPKPDGERSAGGRPRAAQPAKAKRTNEDGSETVRGHDRRQRDPQCAAGGGRCHHGGGHSDRRGCQPSPPRGRKASTTPDWFRHSPRPFRPARSKCWNSFGTPARIAMPSTRWSSRGRRPSPPTSASRGARDVERRASFDRASLLHLGEPGQTRSMHREVFKEIHVNGDPLVAADPNDAAGAERMQTKFVEKIRASRRTSSTRHTIPSRWRPRCSARTNSMQRYRIEGVPTFVVNGKYMADVRSAGSPEQLAGLGQRPRGARTQALVRIDPTNEHHAACRKWSCTRVVVIAGVCDSR